MKIHITMLCDHKIMQKPRSSRMLKLLEDIKTKCKNEDIQLYVISQEQHTKTNTKTKFFTFPPAKSSKERSKEENEAISKYCKKGLFDKLIFTENRNHILKVLYSLPCQDLLIVEDITLLPFACIYKQENKHTKILIDLREFYPLEYENDKEWKHTFGKLFFYLCENYLKYIDIAISVSEGLCEQYKKDFHITCMLFYSLPPFFQHNPIPTNPKHIKILYHGFISPDRSSMELLNLAKLLANTPYTLYVMALSNQKGFLESFKAQAKFLQKLEIVEPVSLENIILEGTRYDIGLIPFKPTTFNLAHCMPNKLFEYMQSRLALLCTPLYDIKTFVQAQQCGVITNGFESYDIAYMLDSISPQTIDTCKVNSHIGAQKWHLGHNMSILENILSNELGIYIE